MNQSGSALLFAAVGLALAGVAFAAIAMERPDVTSLPSPLADTPAQASSTTRTAVFALG